MQVIILELLLCHCTTCLLPTQQVKLSINEEQKHELQQCFRLMDSDGSGAIDAHELNNAFKLLGRFLRMSASGLCIRAALQARETL